MFDMAKRAWQGIAGFMAGAASAFVLVILVEIYSDKVHPLPPESAHSMEAVCAHVAAYPAWVLATVVPMWAATAFVAAWVAGGLGGRVPAAMVSLLVMVALAFNLAMLPYASWFKALMPLAALAGLALGDRAARQIPAGTHHPEPGA
jgi:hypothetical protein